MLGDNGAGKSSFLRSLALALLGPTEALAARQDWNTWLRSREDSGFVHIAVVPDTEYDLFSGKGRTGHAKVLSAAVRLDRDEDAPLARGRVEQAPYAFAGAAGAPYMGNRRGMVLCCLRAVSTFHRWGQGGGANLPVESKTWRPHIVVWGKRRAYRRPLLASRVELQKARTLAGRRTPTTAQTVY
jgi:hypothetical protein